MIEINIKIKEALINDRRIKVQTIYKDAKNYGYKYNIGTIKDPYYITLEELYTIKQGDEKKYYGWLKEYSIIYKKSNLSNIKDILISNLLPYIHKIDNQYYLIDYARDTEDSYTRMEYIVEYKYNGDKKSLIIKDINDLVYVEKYIVNQVLKEEGYKLSEYQEQTFKLLKEKFE